VNLLNDLVIPILVGAFIGFITNMIAIKMLFRPLTEKRIGPFRIPFTPGVIPRQRHKLAASLGRMTSRELMTPEVVQRHLKSSNAQQRLSQKIKDLLAGFLQNTPLAVYLNYHSVVIQGISLFIDLLMPFLDALWDIPISNLLSNPKLNKDSSLITFEDLSSKNPKHTQPPPWLEFIILEVFPFLNKEFQTWIKSPKVTQELNDMGIHLVTQAVDELNTVQRLVVKTMGYEQRLIESMPKLTDLAVRRFINYLKLPENQKDIASRLTNFLTQMLNDQQKKRTFQTHFGEWLDQNREESLGSLLASLLGFGEEQLREIIHRTLDEKKREVAVFLDRFIKESQWSKKPLFEVIQMSDSSIEEISVIASQFLMDSLEAILPGLIEQFDVQTMVENRVNAMDIKKVESLLLQIMEKNFKWINVFGAILGGLIGLFQSLWRLFN